jgi:hypothetical protein
MAKSSSFIDLVYLAFSALALAPLSPACPVECLCFHIPPGSPAYCLLYSFLALFPPSIVPDFISFVFSLFRLPCEMLYRISLGCFRDNVFKFFPTFQHSGIEILSPVCCLLHPFLALFQYSGFPISISIPIPSLFSYLNRYNTAIEKKSSTTHFCDRLFTKKSLSCRLLDCIITQDLTLRWACFSGPAR